ncbi:MAG: hypothetical protein F6K22_26825 [Okeania sp. SIO2F4]|uniref:hypothetical protein n=1 Tax=Okeania sp. SIO2F4 TaxID=2607790 RepID=UPI00142CE8CC|nr:hypothetical protein [Okeania sp. SIO2F4]NES06104.1 hypothetical protein [Okeania sp. SIO2F4]
MTNKRLKIENLDNLEELNTEEVFSIQGGLSVEFPIEDISIEKVDISIKEKLIYPVEPGPIKPYPLPYCRPYPLPYCRPYPTKGGKLQLPWCAVVL